MNVWTIAALVVAVVCTAMLIAVLVQINGLRSEVEQLATKVKIANAKPSTPPAPSAVDERLAAIETLLKGIPAAYGRLERSILAERREALTAMVAAPPSATPRQDPSASTVCDRPPASPFGRVGSETATSRTGDQLQSVETVVDDLEQSVTPDELIEAYRELVSRPRKNEITRWFDDLDGMPCEATDENVFQLVGRGDGARLMLVQLTERLSLVLPSALMVVDFATSFSDVLSARSATRQTFSFDADGSGALRLVQPAMAVLVDGNWRLKAPGRLAGLASG